MGADMYPENALNKDQFISRPGWPCKIAQWRPEAFRQTVGHLPRQKRVAALMAELGWPSSRENGWLRHRLSKWPTDMEIDGTTPQDQLPYFLHQHSSTALLIAKEKAFLCIVHS